MARTLRTSRAERDDSRPTGQDPRAGPGSEGEAGAVRSPGEGEEGAGGNRGDQRPEDGEAEHRHGSFKDLKTTHETHVAHAKANIDADVAKFKASVDELAAKFKTSSAKK